MSVISKARSCLALTLLGIGVASASLGGCAIFGASGESTVAKGKYYASGDPYYDQFFVDLYLLQVSMQEAPKIPEAERERWIRLFKLDQRATPALIEMRWHEEALKLSQTGVRLRLDQSSVSNKPEAASMTIRSNARPKEDPAASLLANVETSGTNLLHWTLTMKQRHEALDRLQLMTIRLDAGVDRTFALAPVGKLSEVKENLADAHKLIALMRARVETVQASTERLLAALINGINTDDGSLGPPIGSDPGNQGSRETGQADPGKKAVGKAHPKSKPASAAPTPAARPKPAMTDSDEPPPAKPRAAKPAPPPRDFEP